MVLRALLLRRRSDLQIFRSGEGWRIRLDAERGIARVAATQFTPRGFETNVGTDGFE